MPHTVPYGSRAVRDRIAESPWVGTEVFVRVTMIGAFDERGLETERDGLAGTLELGFINEIADLCERHVGSRIRRPNDLGARVRAFDPAGMFAARQQLSDIRRPRPAPIMKAPSLQVESADAL